MKESRGQALQVVEQLRAYAIQNTLPDSGDGDELEIIGAEVQQGDAEEGEAYDVQAPHLATVDPPVHRKHDHQGNADICHRVHEHSG